MRHIREETMEYFEFDKEQKNELKELAQNRNNQLSEYATRDDEAIRVAKYKNKEYLRGEFSIDIDKILHNALYSRYVDKTQVFSFYKNDDITRRALHVQLVARISKIIGQALKLNLDLIEAIALGHDIGHTPFGHKGEQFLSELYKQNTGRSFNHNVHSVRNLKIVTNSNLTLQTYDGILCHCGEKAFEEYRPSNLSTFEEFNNIFEKCYTVPQEIDKLKPSTLEGCVVRISDMLAYLEKDRQDAIKTRLYKSNEFVNGGILGKNNSNFLNKVIVNIVKNSMDKPFLKIDKDVYNEIDNIKKENNKKIYASKQVEAPYYDVIKPMMEKIYEKMKNDLQANRFDSPIFKHHLNHTILGNCYRNKERKIVANHDDIVTDYIASMTDDYFLDLFKIEFPDDILNQKVKYVSYFD